MKKNNIGDRLGIHSYKHNGKVHRSWDDGIILDIKEDILIVGNNRVLVTESDGRKWRTKEPAIIYFFKNSWFNVIGQLKKDGIYFYCNIASPYLIEDGMIKYIDYDLDLRVFPDFRYKILDQNEYQYHKKKLEYSNDIDEILHKELDELIKMVRDRKGPFTEGIIKHYNFIYNNFKK